MASSSDSASRYLTIATLNVHGWHNESAGSWEGLIDLLSPADESAPDVLCVQEIRPHKRNVKKSGGGKKRQPPPDILCLEEATKHRIPALAKALGGYHFITRDNTAILSRLPMEAAGPGHWNGSGPQKSKKETRSECRVRHSAARIKPPNGDAEIEVVCLHLDHVSETTRLAQLRQLNEYLASVADKPPVERRIFCGDFNALTKSDYSNEEWKDIFDVRSSNSWESPVREVTRVMKAVRASAAHSNSTAAISKPTPLSAQNAGTDPKGAILHADDRRVGGRTKGAADRAVGDVTVQYAHRLHLSEQCARRRGEGVRALRGDAARVGPQHGEGDNRPEA